MTPLHWTEVDGVPTVWAETPGPLRAGLLFGTGRAHETLVTSGLTHLVEHGALSNVVEQFQRSNGFVGPAWSGFLTMGAPSDVAGFLRGVCEGLATITQERLDAEKQILAAERATRPYDLSSHLLAWRFGARGFGLIGMPEMGRDNVDLDTVHRWSRDRFTRQNGVLWLSGPPPADLSLELPAGDRHPVPELVPVEYAFPGWIVDDSCGGIAASAVVPRVAASSLFCGIAGERLRARLRQELALSYSPAVLYEPLTAERAHVVLYADSDVDRRVELTDAFGEFFQELSVVDESDLASAKHEFRETWTGALAPPEPERMAAEAQRAAMDRLLGREFESLEELADEAAAVSLDDVTEFAADVSADVLFAVPGKARVRAWMGERAAYSVVPVVEGRRVASIDSPVRLERLVHGPDGVSIVWPDGSHVTVRYDSLAAAVAYADGGLGLVGYDGATLSVEPTQWRRGKRVADDIRTRLPDALVLTREPRSADTIPRPASTLWQRVRAGLALPLNGNQPYTGRKTTVAQRRAAVASNWMYAVGAFTAASALALLVDASLPHMIGLASATAAVGLVMGFGLAGQTAAVLVTAFAAVGAILLGSYIRLGRGWAIKTALVVYGLDTLYVISLRDGFSALVHGLVLWTLLVAFATQTEVAERISAARIRRQTPPVPETWEPFQGDAAEASEETPPAP